MKNFINLTSRVINKSHIIEILKKSNRYEIHMRNNNVSGFWIIGSGSINANRNIIKICSEKDKQDYETISKLIDSADE